MNRFIFGILILTGISSSAFAYTDKIDASPQEIYDAAKICFEKQGIYKQDDEKKTLTTRWAYSRIRRARQRKFIPMNLKSNIDLRHQMEIEITPGAAFSEVSIVGRFQEKETDAAPQLPWKNSYSSKELYFKEREFFMRLLTCIETQKKLAHPESELK